MCALNKKCSLRVLVPVQRWLKECLLPLGAFWVSEDGAQCAALRLDDHTAAPVSPQMGLERI